MTLKNDHRCLWNDALLPVVMYKCIKKPFCFGEFRVHYTNRKVEICGLSAVFASQSGRYLNRMSEGVREDGRSFERVCLYRLS